MTPPPTPHVILRLNPTAAPCLSCKAKCYTVASFSSKAGQTITVALCQKCFELGNDQALFYPYEPYLALDL